MLVDIRFILIYRIGNRYVNYCCAGRCPDDGPRAARMPAEDEYGPTSTNTSRRQLLLHHVPAAVSPVPSLPAAPQGPASSGAEPSPPSAGNTPPVAVTCPAGCAITPVERLQVRNLSVCLLGGLYDLYFFVAVQANSQERLSERGSVSSASERLHGCYQAVVSSSERLERFADRFTPNPEKADPTERLRYATMVADRLPTSSGTSSSERYRYPDYRHGGIGSLDRYDRFHGVEERTDRGDRNNERGNNDRFTLERYPAERDRSERDRDRERERDNRDRERTRYHTLHHPTDRYQMAQISQMSQGPQVVTQVPGDYHYTTLPFNHQVPYIPPPSPAPASDRFIPPPPLSPANTPSPDCYPSNPFPSPTTATPTERFIPPPPLSPSPTEKFSPKPDRDRFADKRYPDRYSVSVSVSPNPDKYGTYHVPETRYAERYQCYTPTERYHQHQQQQQQQSSTQAQSQQPQYHLQHPNHQGHHSNSDRYASSNERYLPPTAHTPVERYVPHPQESYYHQSYQSYERYPKWNAQNNSSGDPYMRRDLGYHHHYRLPVPFQQNPYQRMRYSHLGTPNRAKCCGQYQDGYQLSKSSPGSSSSGSSVTSQGKDIGGPYSQIAPPKELTCYQTTELLPAGYHPEKGLHQCGNFAVSKELQCVAYASPGVRVAKVPCKHICSSPSVEYVGQSGGRHVCATPPPPRSASVGGEVHCGDQCCLRRPPQAALHTTTIW